MPDVIIVGAGLAGLSCAKILTSRGVHCLLLEGSDAVGGRVRTDLLEGFRLDRGFQVLLTAYPEAQALLNYSALDLRPFEPGALVQYQNKRHLLADPWRRPFAALPTLFSPVGTLSDKLRVARMRSRALRGSADDLSTLEYLQAQGFSPAFVEQFFRPFFGGIFLEPDLRTSSRTAEFVFRMMALGDTALPRDGMGAISDQLAAGLSIRLHTRVTSLAPRCVHLENGDWLPAKAVVVATDGPTAARLAGAASPPSRGVSCLYFAADHAPLPEALLVLNGERRETRGPVNNFCVLSNVAPTYAPPGAALMAATVLGIHPDEGAVREQLASWFGPAVQRWRHLRTYRIPHAQPEPNSAAYPPGWYVCGDHREGASIQGALLSGRRTAESLLKVL